MLKRVSMVALAAGVAALAIVASAVARPTHLAASTASCKTVQIGMLAPTALITLRIVQGIRN